MQHELVRLGNSLNTLFINAPGSTAGTVQIWFRAGSALESKSDQGIAHFLEHMFFKGTEKRPGAAIAHEVESFGGEINAFTSFDYTCYYINSPNNHIVKTTEILMDMVSNPVFKEEDIVPERGVVFEEYRRSQDNPNQFAFQMIQKGFFTGGYAHPILGTEKNILSFSKEQISSFREKNYSLNNCLLVVAGDLKDKESLKKTIEGFKMPKGEPTKFPKFKLKPKANIDIHHKDTHLAQMSICIQAPSFEDIHAPHEDLALNCLGHGESSRLYQELVINTQLATSCGSSTMFMNDGGFHYIKLIFPLENMTKVLNQFEKLLVATLKDGVEDNDVVKIKNQYVASKIYDMESIESYAFSLGHSFASSGDINSEEEFIGRIKKTTVAEVNESLLRVFKRPVHISIQLPEGVNSQNSQKQISAFQKKINAKLQSIKGNTPKLSNASHSKFDPQVHLIQVKPGVKFIYRQNTMNPTFVLHAYIKGGITEENKNNNGLYQLISSTITKGYQGKEYTELKTELDNLSASLSSFSGKNAYGLTMHGQSEHFPELLDNFIGTLSKPSFKNEHVKHEKELSQTALLNFEKDPVKKCFKKVGEIFFGSHPYAMSITGNKASLKKITGKMIKDTHNSNLKNKEMLITYCGDKSIEEVYSKLEPLFDSLPTRREKKLKPKSVKHPKEKLFHIPMEREQTQIFIGTPIGPMNSEDNVILKMITTHLSGQSSELFVDVRDRKGLCYTAQPVHFSALEAGYWGIYMASGNDKVKPALEAINSIIDKIKVHGIEESEFDRVKKMIAGQSLLNIQTNDDYANIYSVTTLQGMDLDYYHLNNKEIEKLKYSTFKKQIKKIFSGSWYTVLVGKELED